MNNLVLQKFVHTVHHLAQKQVKLWNKICHFNIQTTKKTIFRPVEYKELYKMSLTLSLTPRTLQLSSKSSEKWFYFTILASLRNKKLCSRFLFSILLVTLLKILVLMLLVLNFVLWSVVVIAIEHWNILKLLPLFKKSCFLKPTTIP